MHSSSKNTQVGKDAALNEDRAPDGLRANYGPIGIKAVAAACVGRKATKPGGEIKKLTVQHLRSLDDRADHQE
ncbi:hypothetical protein GCM10008012_63220 [Rhizobium anhuiense]|nr:hypothetical protein GCM10008012_63220 [Rhizobium anhuiense]